MKVSNEYERFDTIHVWKNVGNIANSYSGSENDNHIEILSCAYNIRHTWSRPKILKPGLD